jgi:hypothetical protein
MLAGPGSSQSRAFAPSARAQVLVHRDGLPLLEVPGEARELKRHSLAGRKKNGEQIECVA